MDRDFPVRMQMEKHTECAGHIRRAEEKDTDRVLDLLSQVLWVHHHGRPDIFKPDATKYSRVELLKMFRNDDDPVFVWADENDVAQGYCFCQTEQHVGHAVLTDIRTLYIDDLCVEETMRGRGIGKALYDYAAAYAREKNYYNLTLRVWNLNEPAMRFYKALGLKTQNEHLELILKNGPETAENKPKEE